jgi:hypothetical protein
MHCKKRLAVFPPLAGRVWLVTSRLWTGKPLTFAYSLLTFGVFTQLLTTILVDENFGLDPDSAGPMDQNSEQDLKPYAGRNLTCRA